MTVKTAFIYTQDIVQWVAQSCKHNNKPFSPITGRGFLGSDTNVSFSGIFYSMEFIQWLDTYHKFDTVRVYNFHILFQVATGYVHGVFHRTVKLLRIWMLNAAWNHFHSWKKNNVNSVWFLQLYDTYLDIIILGGWWRWKNSTASHITEQNWVIIREHPLCDTLCNSNWK